MSRRAAACGRRVGRAWGALAVTILLGCGAPAVAISAETAPAADSPARETFSVTYSVEIPAPGADAALVRWELAGIDELERVRLRLDPDRFHDLDASGTLEHRRGEVLWRPGAPYGRLTYTARLRHERASGKGYDTYAAADWVAVRTSALFPRSAVLFRRGIEPRPESRARLVLRLPPSWEAVTALAPDGAHRFIVESPRRSFDHPRGWMLLGRLQRAEAQVAGTAVTVAAPAGHRIPTRGILDLVDSALPLLRPLLGPQPPRLVVVLAPDPMWRGGLSGEESFYMHAERPLRTPDGTSPYLHELFHVLAPFRPAADGHWITEGLAEFYSLELQRRAGRLDAPAYARALRLFARYGVWGHDFTRYADAALRNNSAPLVMALLDRRLRTATHGARNLDAVVAELARDGGSVSTARFFGTVRRIGGRGFGAFFRRYVYRGERPDLGELGA